MLNIPGIDCLQSLAKTGRPFLSQGYTFPRTSTMEGSMKQLMAGLSISLLFSTVTQAACPFAGMYIYEVKTDTRFAVSPESQGTIGRDLFWANEEFFRQFQKPQCRGAYRTAHVVEWATGTLFTYYRTVLDECDGGNTVGIIVPYGKHKAIAEIGDSEIRCY